LVFVCDLDSQEEDIWVIEEAHKVKADGVCIRVILQEEARDGGVFEERRLGDIIGRPGLSHHEPETDSYGSKEEEGAGKDGSVG
jgi:hypothetical protein